MALDYCYGVCTCLVIPVIDSYNSVLNDIFDSNLCNNVYHILIGGDFNTDLSRTQSAHTISLSQICAREFMKYAQHLSQFSIDYMYESNSNFCFPILY